MMMLEPGWPRQSPKEWKAGSAARDFSGIRTGDSDTEGSARVFTVTVPSDATRRPARTRPDARAPAKTGHHFAGIRKRNAAPAWLGGHNVRACPTAHDGGSNSHPARASVECSRRIAAWMHG